MGNGWPTHIYISLYVVSSPHIWMSNAYNYTYDIKTFLIFWASDIKGGKENFIKIASNRMGLRFLFCDTRDLIYPFVEDKHLS